MWFVEQSSPDCSLFLLHHLHGLRLERIGCQHFLDMLQAMLCLLLVHFCIGGFHKVHSTNNKQVCRAEGMHTSSHAHLFSSSVWPDAASQGTLRYMGLVMQGARKVVLACEADPAELHRLLTNLPVLGHLTADELCQQAVNLYNQSRPSRAAANAGLRFVWSVLKKAIFAWVGCCCAGCMCSSIWQKHGATVICCMLHVRGCHAAGA